MLFNLFGNTKHNNFVISCFITMLHVVISKIWILPTSLSIQEGITTFGIILLLWASLYLIDLIKEIAGISKAKRYILLFFITIVNFFPNIYNSISVVASNFFILFIIFQLFRAKNTTDEKKLFFDTSVLLFLAGICYCWAFLFIIPLWFIILLYSASKFRNFFIPIIVFVGLTFLIMSILIPLGYAENFISIFDFDIKFNLYNYTQKHLLLPILFLVLMFLVLLPTFIRKRKKNNISNNFIWFLLIFILSCMVFLSEHKGNSEILFLIFPISSLLSIEFETIGKKWLKETILWIFLILPYLFSIFI